MSFWCFDTGRRLSPAVLARTAAAAPCRCGVQPALGRAKSRGRKAKMRVRAGLWPLPARFASTEPYASATARWTEGHIARGRAGGKSPQLPTEQDFVTVSDG